MLNIKNLKVKINNKLIINNLNLNINKGEVHIILGPNGAGKSTLVNTLSGYINITKGNILFKNKLINNFSITKRAREGIFVSYQHPIELPGITNKIFLLNSINSINKYNKKKIFDNYNFVNLIKKKISLFMIKLPKNWLNNYVNVGLSGGQKKMSDIIQMLILEPKLCILDELDSGLDIDSINILIRIINYLNKNKLITFIIITHYKELINNINVNYIHLLKEGKIINTLDKKNYDK